MLDLPASIEAEALGFSSLRSFYPLAAKNDQEYNTQVPVYITM